VCLETHVYWKGDIARDVARCLAEKAREGVAVHVILDAVGTLPTRTSRPCTSSRWPAPGRRST